MDRVTRPSSARIAAIGGVVAALGGVWLASGPARDQVPAGTSAEPVRTLASVNTFSPPAAREAEPDRRQSAKVPSAAALRDAWSYARAREGEVSLAVVDSEGRLRGRGEDRLYSAASTVKAMLLAAELERLERDGLPLDPATDSLLDAMITYSDNAAADAIYARVGDEGMFAVAERAGMEGFTEAGHWGNAQISAADLARFYSRLDELMAGPQRAYALGLLGSIVPEQSWGIPAAAGERWAVRFKGGWLPDHALVHQAAELRERAGDRELSLAVLTDAQPSHDYGVETVRGVAARLLAER